MKTQGSTLFEVIAVILIVAIIAGYSTPKFIKFMHFQKIGLVEDRIIQIISVTQSNAEQESTSKSLQFKTVNGIPYVIESSLHEEQSKRLLNEHELKPGQIEVFGQMDNLIITFNHKGMVVSQTPYVVKVASPKRDADTSYRGCVVVWTIFGNTKKGSSASECPTRKGAPAPQGKIIYRKS